MKHTKTPELNKQEKQRQAILYAIERGSGQMNRTKLMMYIFFIDLFAKNSFGETLLEDTYLNYSTTPAPDFGFTYTDIEEEDSHPDISVMRILDPNDRIHSHYEYTLREGVHPNLSDFSEIERDLLTLTLDAVTARPVYRMNLFIQKLKYQNLGSTITSDELKLSSAKFRDLEMMLHTKIYGSSFNNAHILPGGNIGSYIREVFENYISYRQKNLRLQKRLPVIIDTKTGRQVWSRGK